VEPLIAALHLEQAQMKRQIQETHDSIERDGDVAKFQRQFHERRREIVKAANGRMHSSAAVILSPTQLRRLDAMLQRDLDRLEAEAQIERIRNKIDQAGPVNANAPD
jgi:chromosome segregation ATPase